MTYCATVQLLSPGFIPSSPFHHPPCPLPMQKLPFLRFSPIPPTAHPHHHHLPCIGRMDFSPQRRYPAASNCSGGLAALVSGSDALLAFYWQNVHSTCGGLGDRIGLTNTERTPVNGPVSTGVVGNGMYSVCLLNMLKNMPCLLCT